MQNTSKINALNIQIGKRIALLRHEKKLTQEQLSEVLDISIKHCSAVERGKSSLSMEKLITLCRLFDVSLDYLIGWKDDKSVQYVPKFVIDMFHNATPETRETLIDLMKSLQQLTDENSKNSL